MKPETKARFKRTVTGMLIGATTGLIGGEVGLVMSKEIDKMNPLHDLVYLSIVIGAIGVGFEFWRLKE